jgi:hypothetical protein
MVPRQFDRCLEQPLAGRGSDRAPDPRRHCRSRAARPQGELDLALVGRPEGAARDQEHGTVAVQRDQRAVAGRGRRTCNLFPNQAVGRPHAISSSPALKAHFATNELRTFVPCSRPDYAPLRLPRQNAALGRSNGCLGILIPKLEFLMPFGRTKPN